MEYDSNIRAESADCVSFDSNKAKESVAAWIRDWFDRNGKGCNAVIGISGGKDSSVTAALCVEALGKDHVIGVLMPNGEQADIGVARALVEHLGIRSFTVNIGSCFNALTDEIKTSLNGISDQTLFNLPARLRMSTVYAVSQSMNGRVANTCNLSEDWVGYSTRYGDSVGDFSPLSFFTVEEVRAIGRELGLPSAFVDKVPIDGLCGKTDEDNLGFTYAVLDKYLRTGICEDETVKAKIDRLHRTNKFKLQLMEHYPHDGLIKAAD